MNSRRNFLTKAGTAAAGTALSVSTPRPASATTWKRSPTHDSLIRIGALTSGHHHHLYSIWGP